MSRSSCSKDLRHFVAQVVDDLEGDATGLGFGEGAGDVASRIEKLPSCRVAERPKNALFRIWNRTFLNYRSTVATNDISLARYESRPERLVRRLPSLHADPQLVDRPASSFHGDEQQALLYHIRAPAQCDLYVAKALA